METIKNLLAATLLISMLSACGCTRNNGTVTSSPSPTATARPETTDNANKAMEDAATDTGDAVKDAGNAVGNTVAGVTDAVGNAVTPDNK